MPWEWPVGALCAFLVTLVTTPAGVSGAVLLLPIQLSILNVLIACLVAARYIQTGVQQTQLPRPAHATTR